MKCTQYVEFYFSQWFSKNKAIFKQSFSKICIESYVSGLIELIYCSKMFEKKQFYDRSHSIEVHVVRQINKMF